MDRLEQLARDGYDKLIGLELHDIAVDGCSTKAPCGSIVFAALAVTHLIQDRTGWSIKKFIRTARRYRTVQIRAGQHTMTAEDPLPADLRDALALIN